MTFIMPVIAVLFIATTMTMTGRGGGNFYTLILVATGFTIHEGATFSQFLMVVTSVTAILIFQKHKTIDWKLALILEPTTTVMAFFGGYYSYNFNNMTLKLILAFLLVIASFFMLYPVKENKIEQKKYPGFWHRQWGDYKYTVNLWLALPFTAITGFMAGMVGISGGSFKVPLMVLACGVPMKIAVGTSSAMIGATALTGFLGHISRAGINNKEILLPLAIASISGGLLGSRLAFKFKNKNLKKIFAFTTLAAAVFMFLNALYTK